MQYRFLSVVRLVMSYTIFRWHSNKEKTQNDWKGKRCWADKKNVGGKHRELMEFLKKKEEKKDERQKEKEDLFRNSFN